MTRLLIGLIRLYQRLLSPVLPPTCRFWPTCSEYAARALAAHGVWRGSWLALRRLVRCHPFNPGGDDPVPPPRRNTNRVTAEGPTDGVPVRHDGRGA